MTGELDLNKHQGHKISCLCGECHRKTQHEIVVDAMRRGSQGPVENSINWAIEYQIIRCLGCETISFRKATGSDWDYTPIGEDEWEYLPDIEIYPNPRDGRQPLSDSNLLPDKIQRIYEESLQALNSTQPVLCGIGIRAILETVCKDKSATGKNLDSQINSLVELGVLTRDGAAILHKLRILGNHAAHEVTPHTLQELGLAFDVVDHLLLGVYLLPEHAKKTFK